MANFTEGKTPYQKRIQSRGIINTLIPGLLCVYAISGCDTVPMHNGIGKQKALYVPGNLKLSFLKDQCLSESRKFVAAYCGAKNENFLKNSRYTCF